MTNLIASVLAPHSWGVAEWPKDVYPHKAGRVRYVLRIYRDELIAAGALVRVAGSLVVLGAQYTAWLESRGPYVASAVMARREKWARPGKQADAVAA